MSSSGERTDRGGAWADLKGHDITESILARAKGRPEAAAPAQVVNATTENGDIINLGPMPPEALAEFLAARRRKPKET